MVGSFLGQWTISGLTRPLVLQQEGVH